MFIIMLIMNFTHIYIVDFLPKFTLNYPYEL